ncbi:MAG: hypothetical protein PHE24_00750 [Patescibacteria group bacterium]|nr:hypothetical protein [Patescibacteria group bacterium]
MKFFQTTGGFATIPTILALSALILVAAVGIAAATYTQTTTNAAVEQSAAALSYAEAGAKDALMRIARDKNYACASVDCYTLDMAPNGCLTGAGCAKISVSADAGTTEYPKIIAAKGIVQNKTRTLEVQVTYDLAGYGEINSATWSELTN